MLVNGRKTVFIRCIFVDFTFPHPGTSTPLMGLGISILRTTPYLEHSSLTSSKISVQEKYDEVL